MSRLKLDHTKILILIAILIAVCGVVSFIVPPTIFSDPAWGFLVWKSMSAGAGFNQITIPDITDISKDITRFVAWWSPGQYLVPSLLTSLGLSLGHALAVTSLVFNILCITGFYLLFVRLGFSRLTSALSCAIIVTTALFIIQFSTYSGGTILLYGATPWIILFALRFMKMELWHIPALVLVFCVGAFFKHAFALTAVAILVSFFIYQYTESMEFDFGKLFLYGLMILACFFIFYAIVHFGYTTHDLTPNEVASTKLAAPVHPVKALLYSFVGPIYGAFSIGLFFANPLYFQGMDFPETYHYQPAVLIPFLLLTAAIVYSVVRNRERKLYAAIVLGFLGTYALFFTYFMVSAVDVGTGDRQYRMVGLLLLPAIVEIIRHHPRKLIRVGLLVIVLFFAASGITNFVWRTKIINEHDNLSPQGFSHHMISRRGLKLLLGLDSNIPAANNLFYVTFPDVALEVHRNRVISSQATQQELENLQRTKYKGRTDNLVLLMEAKLLDDGKAEAILKSFVDYDYEAWHSFAIDEKKEGTFVVYYQGTLTPALDQMGRMIVQQREDE